MRIFGRVVLVCTLLACSNDDASTVDGGDDATSDVTVDVSSDVAQSDASDAGVESGPTGNSARGTIGFNRDDFNGLIYPTAGAGFQITVDGGPFPPDPTPQPCTAQVGSCCFWHFTPSDGGFSDAGVPPQVWRYACAGPITMTDNGATMGTINCTDAGTYAGITKSWNDGDSLHASAPGAEIHAFSNGIGAAALFKNITPKFSTSSALSVSVSKDLVMTWTKAFGEIDLFLVDSSALNQIECKTSTDLGTITVDHTLLANMVQGKGTATLTRTITGQVICDNADVIIQSSADIPGQATFGP